MSLYSYSPLPEDHIRLLRLEPHADEQAPIQCHLLDYYLPQSGKGVHLYEALSYVWGSMSTPRFVQIGEYNFPVRENLYAALLRLRDDRFDRIIWVDAICINQKDIEERGRQVQSMAKIFAKACRVTVWLGESALNSDEGLEGIRIAADDQSVNWPNNEMLHQAILALLQRPWFRRVWVLQEVAAARNILIRCGSIEIDGFTFCLGLGSLNLSYTSDPGLQSLIRSAIYLIRGAIFRPKQIAHKRGRFSLDIRALGDLMDMYHTREATELLDKVYAVLGMSSDGLNASELPVDYQISWKELFQRLVKFLLYKEILVETWDHSQTATIRSNGCVLGKVQLVEKGAHDDRQNVQVSAKDAAKFSGRKQWKLTLSASAKIIREGDIVCLLRKAPKPMIIRLCEDHFTIIMITVTPMAETSEHKSWSNFVETIVTFQRDFLLVWDWEGPLGKPKEQNYESLMESRGLKHTVTELQENDEKADRLWNAAMILADSESYEEATCALQSAMDDYEKLLRLTHSKKLLGMKTLASVFEKNKEWERAEQQHLEIIQIRKDVQGLEHPDTLAGMANLASMYQRQGNSKKMAKVKVMMDLLIRMRDYIYVTEKTIVGIAKSFDQDVMGLLFERGEKVLIIERVVGAAAANRSHGKQVLKLIFEKEEGISPITERVVKAAAGNWDSGVEVLELLFEQRGEDILITERVVNAAAGNWKNGKDIMALLLKKRGDKVPVTEKVIQVAAKNNGDGKHILALLLEQRGKVIQITVRVAEIVTKNWDRGKEVMADLLKEQKEETVAIAKWISTATRDWSGKEVMKLLLEQQGNEIPITEEVVASLAGDGYNGENMMKVLFEQRGKGVPVTERVAEAAASNWNGGEVMTLLFTQRGYKVPVTERVVLAAARNQNNGVEVMMAFFKERGKELPITEKVVEAVARNGQNERKVMMFLFEQLGDKVPITERVVEAAAESQKYAQHLLEFLFSQRGDKIPVTERVVEAAARNPNAKRVLEILFKEVRNRAAVGEEVELKKMLEERLGIGKG